MYSRGGKTRPWGDLKLVLISTAEPGAAQLVDKLPRYTKKPQKPF